MSRIIIKNLPKQTTDEQLRETFGTKGLITDVARKFTKNGKFRGFAFIGYKTEKEAKEAQTYFDSTFMGSSKIHVDICADLGDETKPRSWSKHTVKDEKKKIEKEPQKEKVVKKDKNSEMLEELKNDPNFNEFVEINKRKHEKTSWGNDLGEIKVGNEDLETQEEITVTKEKKMSDLEYLKSKTVAKIKEIRDNSFTVVMRNIPYKCNKNDIRKFLTPIKPVSIRLPPKVKGLAYVKLSSEKDWKNTLNKRNSFFDGHKVSITNYKEKPQKNGDEKDFVEKKWKNAEEELKNEETIAESGRIFVRNVPYTTTEDELEAHFKPFGALAEVALPVDKFTNSGKGFAFVTYVFPHDAAKAEKELDGKIFQGRMLHLLRAKQKPSNDDDENSQSFKEKKINKQKEMKNNWNSLFLGTNAVAELVAEKYNISKRELLNPETSKHSVPVHLALGETEIVTETKEFLEKNGVHLSAFDKAPTERSKTVMLVKNLPSKTFAEELKELFTPFGSIRRLVLPPHGITAIVEFEVPDHARKAFRSLAYTKFKYMPLYLEWGPNDALSKDVPKVNEETKKVQSEEKQETFFISKTGTPVDETTSTLSTTQKRCKILVRNIPFQATEKEVEQLFAPFGLLSFVHLPLRPSSNHRGFAFIKYASHHDAQRAFTSLSASTHLFGRRLVLEWAKNDDDDNATTATTPSSFHQSRSTKRKSSPSAMMGERVTKTKRVDA